MRRCFASRSCGNCTRHFGDVRNCFSQRMMLPSLPLENTSHIPYVHMTRQVEGVKWSTDAWNYVHKNANNSNGNIPERSLYHRQKKVLKTVMNPDPHQREPPQTSTRSRMLSTTVPQMLSQMPPDAPIPSRSPESFFCEVRAFRAVNVVTHLR